MGRPQGAQVHKEAAFYAECAALARSLEVAARRQTTPERVTFFTVATCCDLAYDPGPGQSAWRSASCSPLLKHNRQRGGVGEVAHPATVGGAPSATVAWSIESASFVLAVTNQESQHDHQDYRRRNRIKMVRAGRAPQL
jgi:hypothetical protein